ncbi:putative NAD(P)/FAD-binding protein YdhS [Murinocardiopsis flavida]|uniref:Putative NAD(P)/FAD-binding protein YdhS n=1 Tax=Murinocardiopsis flavida TaxID=645275 RepID=A0A2P8DLQ8_9ACTN|nr:FAD/NAD(P)-binding protein [Murinocardiopsis flavida]PSK98117.1 putative NAD(P)/FAD-binding protein YdhS [Murinocardiopsis flavida]
MSNQVPTARPVIAFVGGGASATVTAIALLRATAWLRLRYRIVVIDEHGRHGRGTAYATADPRHLLNSPAKSMSALPDRPGHLVEWAAKSGVPCGPDTFLPRSCYGDYLDASLATAAAGAAPHAEVVFRRDRVVAAHADADRVVLELPGGARMEAAAAVFATGGTPASLPTVLGGTFDAARTGGAPVVADPWHPVSGFASLRGCGAALAVGTGLTMVDTALSMCAADPDTVVHAVSRRGLVPRRHRLPLVAPPGLVDLRSTDGAPLPLRTLLRRLRAAIDAYPGDWRHVVDSVRPHTADLWQGLTPAEQEVFLARLARHWESARHRMAPEVADRFDHLRASGRVRLHTGRVTALEDDGRRSSARLSDGTVIDVDAVVNCTGGVPARSPLIRRLISDGTARPDHLGLGLATCPRGALVTPSGLVSRRLFALGPVRRGQLYETTAIPEIRAQAEPLAERIADTVLRNRRVAPATIP